MHRARSKFSSETLAVTVVTSEVTAASHGRTQSG